MIAKIFTCAIAILFFLVFEGCSDSSAPVFTNKTEDTVRIFNDCMEQIKFAQDRSLITESNRSFTEEELNDVRKWLATSAIPIAKLKEYQNSCRYTATKLAGVYCVANCGNDSDAINSIRGILNKERGEE